MEITSAALYRFELPLARAVHLGDQVCTSRKGLILCLESADGQGIGEISPLPGFSRESSGDVEAQLTDLLPVLTGPVLSGSLTTMALQQHCRQRLYPSVQFGVEMAVLNLLATAAGRSVRHTLAAALPGDVAVRTGPVPVIRLLSGDRQRVLDGATAAREAGVAAVKLKVSCHAGDAGLVRDVRGILGSEIRLTLDANRSGGYAMAWRFGAAVRDCGLAWIEEPCDDPQRFADLFSETGIPYALDETLQDPAATPAVTPGTGALVVKPQLCGGVQRTLGLWQLARQTGTGLVISSARETAVARHFLAELAAVLTPTEPAGLDTADFQVDLFNPAQPEILQMDLLEALRRV